MSSLTSSSDRWIAQTETTHKLQFKNALHVIYSPECSGWGEEADCIISWAAWNQGGSLFYPISSWVGYHNYWEGHLQPLAHGIGKSDHCNTEANLNYKQSGKKNCQYSTIVIPIKTMWELVMKFPHLEKGNGLNFLQYCLPRLSKLFVQQ